MTLKLYTTDTWKPTTVGQNGISTWGITWGMLSAQKLWSLTFPDAKTARFEVRPGDTFAWDGANADAANRSEIQATPPVPNGTPFFVAYIAARIAALAAEPNLAAIVLTDTQVLPASSPNDPVLQKHSLPALNAIQGDFTICMSEAATGKPYDRQDWIYDRQQKLIKQVRYKAGQVLS